MIKRINDDDLSSSDDDDDIKMNDNNNNNDELLSDYDSDKIDDELELENIDKKLLLNSKLLPHQIGRIRSKLHSKQEKTKQNLSNILNSNVIHKNDRLRKTRYINKQRTLIFASRGINQRMRHLMDDLKILIPHSKSEPKYDNKRNLTEIKEICTFRNCNNCIFFESRRNTDLYLWISRIPNGPSIKFYVTNVHTLNELRMTGNCLKGSRPILVFDKKFDNSGVQFKVMKELLFQIFGTPNGDPRSKPFIDHVLSFMILDHKIWIRNYEIVFEDDNGIKKKEPILVEIGPRLVLHPIRIQQGSFCGSTIYQDPFFVNPNVQRRAIKSQLQLKTALYGDKLMKKIAKSDRKAKINKDINKILDNDNINDVFQKGIDFD